MLTQVHKLQIHDNVERILHVPGNYRGGALEMTLVLDYNLSGDCVRELSRELASALKSQGEIFRNVRLNTYRWISDSSLVKEVTPLAFLQLGGYFEDYEQHQEEKTLELLAAQLKLFSARSKLVILLTDGRNRVASTDQMKKNMQPFLEKKIMIITCNDGIIKISRKF